MNEPNDEISRIRGRIKNNSYNSLVDGVSTFDAAAMFEDMRALLKAATAAYAQGGADENAAYLPYKAKEQEAAFTEYMGRTEAAFPYDFFCAGATFGRADAVVGIKAAVEAEKVDDQSGRLSLDAAFNRGVRTALAAIDAYGTKEGVE